MLSTKSRALIFYFTGNLTAINQPAKSPRYPLFSPRCQLSPGSTPVAQAYNDGSATFLYATECTLSDECDPGTLMNHMDSSQMVEPIVLDLADSANASDAVELVSMLCGLSPPHLANLRSDGYLSAGDGDFR